MMSRRHVAFALAAAGAAGVLPRRSFAQAKQADVLSRDSVLRDPAAPVVGNASADFAIVEYFDYQCPACKQVRPVLQQVVKEDGKIRLVLKDWPIFGDMSRNAARLALAAKYQGKYEQAHVALFSATSRLTDQSMRDLLAEGGVDVAKALADLESNGQEIDSLLKRNDTQATAFGFPGTPAFIVGTFRVPGVLNAAAFKQAIKDARAAARKKN